MIKTADWKTYRNEEYWFEVKYPLDVRIQDDGYIDYLNGIRIIFCGGEYAKFCGIKGTGAHPEIYFFKLKKEGVKKRTLFFLSYERQLPR
ncbi:MAG: hypothetical protein COT33_01825 [Candidatus Nealsonbacteria bacterium CG08_land_8_20_14_0_20_38_20]|uniref:Uncharacterized protein n=1 Tax=Candidatus Nealsonbacteria bacterium CG08_land_8_20_14_0_20_38_20 TaxID=1974705 RepID=A0A2H0YLU4_9BACT|nr:MAG: hypothetical protein COT33_01825 [Candidatus Nealsonbacteria bacterium CG08_land_8_20_14_0_20_38_20]